MPYLKNKNGDRREIIDTSKNGKAIYLEYNGYCRWLLLEDLLADGWTVEEEGVDLGKNGTCTICEKRFCICKERQPDGGWTEEEDEKQECEHDKSDITLKPCLQNGKYSLECETCREVNKPTPWTPEVGEEYFAPDIRYPKSDGGIDNRYWNNNTYDLHRLALGIVCRTRAEAEAKYDEIIGLIKK